MQWPRFFKVYSLDYRFDQADSLANNPRQAILPDRYGLCRGATLVLPAEYVRLIDDIYEARIRFDTVIAYQNSYYHNEIGDQSLLSAFIGIGNQPDFPVAELRATPLDTTMNMLPFRLALPNGGASWLYNLPWQDLGRSTKSTKYRLVFGRPELSRVSRIQTVSSIEKVGIYRFGFNGTILEHNNLGTQVGTAFPLTRIELKVDDIQQPRQNAELIQFLPTVSNLMIMAHAFPAEDIEAPLSSFPWPSKIEVIRPVIVTEPGFENGAGEPEVSGRPRTNAAYIGQYQGVRGSFKYWIGPTEAGQKELYKFEDLATTRTEIEGLAFEVLCGPDYVPQESDFSFLVSFQGEEKEIPWKQWSDRTLLILGPAQGEEFRTIISTFVPLDPFTGKPWKPANINKMQFGFRIGDSPFTFPTTSISFACYRIISVESEQERAHISRSGTVPIYKNLDPAFQSTFLTESDESKIYKPSAYRFYLDVHRPEVVAQASIIPPGRNMVQDGSFEILGANPDKSKWVLAAPVAVRYTGDSQAWDGKYSVCTPAGFTAEQQISVPASHWGTQWKIGGMIASVSSTTGFIDMTIDFGGGVTRRARVDSQSIPNNVWVESWSNPIIVPEVNEATVILSKTGDGWGYFDVVVVGPADNITFAWAWVEPYQFTMRGSIIVPIGEFVSGSWSDLKPGMTIRAGDQDVRLRELHEQWSYIKVAENDIDWGSLTTIEFLNEFRYWLRYQRMVALGFSPGGEEEERYRESQLERNAPSAPESLPAPESAGPG